MPLPEIKYCSCTLQPGFATYSAAGQLALFGSRTKNVSHILPFGSPGKSNELTRSYNEKRKVISISGVQEKYYLQLNKNTLSLGDRAGSHILKPIPTVRLERVSDLPANEHVSMQIARQVYGINTASCGIIFFEDGEPAYITRRFDFKPDGSGKYRLEDFAALLSKTPEREGDVFKYNAAYIDIAQQIQRYAAAAPVVLLEFFRIVVFNYLIGNGDAHLKNFSLMETEQGDFILSPAYDLLCTALHIDDSKLALHNGLYPGDYEEKSYATFGTYTRASFIVFAEMIGINTAVATKVVDKIIKGVPDAIALIDRSFLSEDAKYNYINILKDRQRCLLLSESAE
ncbi:serine/threonine-protein kinase HipA [Filimonas lacunae]|uniref:Serine/threonine-protein kinase HipA n=1 Tax=Filimonas lacunae TaxID=477680 RepID=A0A173MQ27_9BACT|nr:HipA domain-containing protein [Filimonas lacunae]BAV09596.1 HipA protein [Filimonas lacunae]SIS75707.1 serine/threonine-protein kinase HipA [Filimonas lacunae]